MKRMKAFFIVCCLTILCLLQCPASTLFAQSSGSQSGGQIKGAVLDIADGRVTNAGIRIESQEFKWEGVTDSEGEFTADVPTGTYRIYVEVEGFRKFESALLKVKSNVIELVNIHLNVAPAIDTIKIAPQQPT